MFEVALVLEKRRDLTLLTPTPTTTSESDPYVVPAC